MRTGFTPLVNPPSSIRDHQGTPTDDARSLVSALQGSTTEWSARFHIGRIEDRLKVTEYVPDQRYLTKALEEYEALQTASSPVAAL